MLRSLVTATGCLALLLNQGCTSTCDGVSDTPIAFTGGTTDPTGTVYETSDWDGPYLSFPADRVFDLRHDLRAAPQVVVSYLAFEENPLQGEGSVAESAGNMVLIGPVTDEFIRVKNDTCQHFYLRVAAFVAPEPGAAGGSGGAGGTGNQAGAAGEAGEGGAAGAL